MGRFQAALPDDVKVSYQFDESPIVYRAIESVGVEGALGAGLTGLMVLLFLRDLRAVIVVVLNIPLALLGSIVVLNLTGNTINIMTLGGLALAIGILVDEATVEIENIHTQMEHTASMSRAVRQGNMETAVPRLLALLCILSVFIPSFIMQGAVRALFVPLSLAVGGAMVTSYLLSSTFVPVLCVWLLANRHDPHAARASGRASLSGCRIAMSGWFRGRSRTAASWCSLTCSRRLPWWSSWAAALAVSFSRGSTPASSSSACGRRREPTTSSPRQVAQKTLDVIAEEVGPDKVDVTMGYAGAQPAAISRSTWPTFGAGAPTTACCGSPCAKEARSTYSSCKSGCGRPCRRRWAPGSVRSCSAWASRPQQADQRVADMVFAFEPGDLISETMSLGAPAPIEVVVSGRNLAEASTYMDKLREQFDGIESLRDVQIQQSLHYPTVQVTLDRERAGLSGVTARDIGESLIAATYSSRYTTRIFWRDEVSGNSYQVQVQVPPPRMTEATDVELVPLLAAGRPRSDPRRPADTPSTPKPPLLIRDVARVMRSEMVGEVDRYNMRRYLSLTANIEGEDLGRVINRLDAAINRAGEPPKGTEVELRGQVGPMRRYVLVARRSAWAWPWS